MPIGAPRTWSNGDVVGATVLNTELRDQVYALTNAPRAKIFRDNSGAVGSTISTSTFTLKDLPQLQFDSVAFDFSYNGTTMAEGSNLVIKVPGLYTLEAAWTFDNKSSNNTSSTTNPADWGTRSLGIGVNGVGYLNGTDASRAIMIAMYDSAANIAGDASETGPLPYVMSLSASARFNAGDSIGLYGGLANSIGTGVSNGISIDIIPGAATCYLQAQWEAVS